MSEFWKSVHELAALRALIPEERRAMSGVRLFFEEQRRQSEKQRHR